jgi:hypothetical protein
MEMNKWWKLLSVLAVVLIVTSGPLFAQMGMMGRGMMGYGTMEGYGYGMMGMGPGMMMGSGMMGMGMMHGGMMGPGMMGGWGAQDPNAKSITLDEAVDSVQRYLNAYGNDLSVAEVMEFALNFYAEIEEEDTGIHAMELLINKYTGQVYPEMGPNMMWNTKYGMMGGGKPTAKMPISPKQAEAQAQKYLDAYMPGITAGHAETFYGYYTLHTLKDGKIEGMLSVNGYTGAVWYHSWHGEFIRMKEFD